MYEPELGNYVHKRMRYHLRLHRMQHIDSNLGPLGFLNTEGERQRQKAYAARLPLAERIEFVLYKSYHRNRLN